jgi:hypothetical protein
VTTCDFCEGYQEISNGGVVIQAGWKGITTSVISLLFASDIPNRSVFSSLYVRLNVQFIIALLQSARYGTHTGILSQ